MVDAAFTGWDHTTGECLLARGGELYEASLPTQTKLANFVKSSYRPMHLKPILLPLNLEEVIYVLQDERGKLISAGSREVCELLLQTLNKDGSDVGVSEIAWFVNDMAMTGGMRGN